jgi:hypothetical protein
MNYFKRCWIAYAIWTISGISATDSFNQKFISDILIPFEVELSLDFLKNEIEESKDILQNEWDSPRSQKIIQKAEHLVQDNPEKFKKNITNSIISFFSNIDINIIFNQDDMIIKRDIIDDKNLTIINNEQNNQNIRRLEFLQEQAQAKKKHAQNKKETGYKDLKPKKIRGARRSMKKLQQYHADKEKKEKERHKELLEAFHKHPKKKKKAATKRNDLQDNQEELQKKRTISHQENFTNGQKSKKFEPIIHDQEHEFPTRGLN